MGEAVKPKNTAPRHNWKHHEGTNAVHPSTIVERCAYCGALKKMKEVETSRIGVTKASFSWKDVPIYSTDDGAGWKWAKPDCTGKPAKTAVAR